MIIVLCLLFSYYFLPSIFLSFTSFGESYPLFNFYHHNIWVAMAEKMLEKGKSVQYCRSKECKSKPRSRLSSLDVHSFCEACRGRRCSFQDSCPECSEWEEDDFAKLAARIASNAKKAKKSVAASPSTPGSSTPAAVNAPPPLILKNL